MAPTANENLKKMEEQRQTLQERNRMDYSCMRSSLTQIESLCCCSHMLYIYFLLWSGLNYLQHEKFFNQSRTQGFLNRKHMLYY